MRNYRVFAFVVSAVIFPLIASAQLPSDSQTLQSLLEEVRHLRQDLQFTASTLQRMQILLYRIRTQLDAVAQARQRHDEAQFTLTQMRAQREQASSGIKEQEDSFNRSDDPNTRKYAEVQIERMKYWIEQAAQHEPEAQAKETECANELRIEKAKLDDFEDQLNRLDSQLSAVRQPQDRPR